MIPAYFLQRDIEDPWPAYAAMIDQHPARFDNSTGCWVIYSYKWCRQILGHPGTIIPPVTHDALGEFAVRIKTKLARLNNDTPHSIAKSVNRLLMENRRIVEIARVMERLLRYAGNTKKLDWVNIFSKKLAALVLLESFEFYDDDAAYVLELMDRLTQIMLPEGKPGDTSALNTITEEIYFAVRRKILAGQWFKQAASALSISHQLTEEESLDWLTGNLIGLLIQSHDAGRGLLSNTMLSLLTIPGILQNDLSKQYIQDIVIETMRFNGPVHITRRLAKEDIVIDDITIRKNEMIIVTLAAANRDPAQFIHANQFDTTRINNDTQLGFGAGIHQCPGSNYAMTLAVDALYWLFHKYDQINLVENNIRYEPLINLRLPQQLLISFS